MEMDRAHTSKTNVKHHQTGSDVESSGEEKDRSAKKHLAKRFAGRHQEDGIHLVTDRKESQRSGTLEVRCRWPIPQKGCKGISK